MPYTQEPGQTDHPNSPELWDTIHIEQFPHTSGPMHDKYYIIRYGTKFSLNQFLHRDGTWHDHAGPHGAYDTKPEALQILAQHHPR